MTLGERIKQARLAASLSLRALGEETGLSATAISKYENNKARPGPASLVRLADALGVQTEYFLRTRTVTLECPAYRSRASLGSRVRAAIENEAKEALERYFTLESVFGPDRMPHFKTKAQSIGTIDDAEDIAEGLRRIWQLGTDPMGNLTETLESRNVKVILVRARQGFDGFSCWADGAVPVVISRRDVPGDRQRFNLAHELGHLLLIPKDGVDQEKAAYRFAGAFLAPRQAVLGELGSTRTAISLSELAYLKQKYGLSMQAWLHRARELGIITESRYRSYRRSFNARGWRITEPGEQMPPEEPKRFTLLLTQALAEGLLTPARAAQLSREVPSPTSPAPTSAEMRAAAEAAAEVYGDDPELTIATRLNTEDIVDA